MTIPYWLYKVKDHSPGWSGWRYKAIVISRKGLAPCDTCGNVDHWWYTNSPLRRPT